MAGWGGLGGVQDEVGEGGVGESGVGEGGVGWVRVGWVTASGPNDKPIPARVTRLTTAQTAGRGDTGEINGPSLTRLTDPAAQLTARSYIQLTDRQGLLNVSTHIWRTC